MQFPEFQTMIDTTLRLAAEAVGGEACVVYNPALRAWSLQDGDSFSPDYVRVAPTLGATTGIQFSVLVYTGSYTMTPEEAVRRARCLQHFAQAAETCAALCKDRVWDPESL